MIQPMDRYHRQTLLPQLGRAGQDRLAHAHVLLIGCGALGCSIAQQLARSGIGHIRIVDRDLVDQTNLHRQILFTEADAAAGLPKAIAAARALTTANSQITIEPIVADVNSANIQALAGVRTTKGKSDGFHAQLILDGTDNAQTRYLINDLAVQQGIAWVYGACVGVEGRVMPIVPGSTPCLRCLFPDPPTPGELATCDTAGVLPAAAGAVGALQAGLAIRLLVEGNAGAGDVDLLAFDVWTMRFRSIKTAGARRDDCPCCGKHHFEFLDRPASSDAATLCGRSAVQVRPAREAEIDLDQMAARLSGAGMGEVQNMGFMLRCLLPSPQGVRLSIFPDGRVLVDGTGDVALARSLVARYVGA
jgi:molybdopterin-synthase adenylyltransferase